MLIMNMFIVYIYFIIIIVIVIMLLRIPHLVPYPRKEYWKAMVRQHPKVAHGHMYIHPFTRSTHYMSNYQQTYQQWYNSYLTCQVSTQPFSLLWFPHQDSNALFRNSFLEVVYSWRGLNQWVATISKQRVTYQTPRCKMPGPWVEIHCMI